MAEPGFIGSGPLIGPPWAMVDALLCFLLRNVAHAAAMDGKVLLYIHACLLVWVRTFGKLFLF